VIYDEIKKRHENFVIDRRICCSGQIMVVDSGTDDTFVSSVVFYALAEAVASAMGDRGYYREAYGGRKVCFRPAAAGGELERPAGGGDAVPEGGTETAAGERVPPAVRWSGVLGVPA
jgi:hypothetical protein